MIENLSSYDSATGKKLAMRVFLPGSGERPRAGVVVVHGLGDYIQRYQEVAEMMTGIGIAVVGIDLPGHGESEGKRGKVGRLSDVHTVIDEARSALREMVEPVGGKIGALAHSTGGLLLFDYLTRYPGNFAFAWVNACLVDPTHRRGPKAAALARIGKLILPGYTISTKVTPSMGRSGAPDEQPPAEDRKGHDRVSVRFASDLIGARERIAVHHKNLSKDFRLLMTHGGKDEVCPIGYAREFYSKLQIRMKEFREYPEHLHHLFHDPLVIDFGRDWLNRVLEPPRLVKRC